MVVPVQSGVVARTLRPDGSSWIRPTVFLAALAVGIGAEVLSWDSLASSLSDVLVGWICIAAGSVLLGRRADRRVGVPLVAGGFLWFVGNFSSVPIAPVATVATQLTLIHRAAFVHAASAAVGCRTWALRAVVVGTYAAWSFPAIEDRPLTTAGVCVAAVVVAGAELLMQSRPVRPPQLVGLAALVLLGAAFVAVALVHSTVRSGAADVAVLMVDELAIVAVAIGLAFATRLGRVEAGRLTDLLVEAARTRSDGVRAALARALTDPSLELGYWHPGSGQYLDRRAEPVRPPADPMTRHQLRVDADGEPVALVVHEAALLEANALEEAVRGATVLAAAHARLSGDVLDQLAEAAASRRRLLLAGDAERARLQHRIDRGPITRARELGRLLEDLATEAAASREDDAARELREARNRLNQVIVDLERVAIGLHPATLDELGLAGALHVLADQAPLPVTISCDLEGLPEPIQLAVYYVAAEAIANAVKHASATSVSVHVAREQASLVLTVVDDGVGGADLRAGTGLRGARDRIEALGGHLVVRSETGVGTGIRVELPV